jgi:hypothetical protein
MEVCNRVRFAFGDTSVAPSQVHSPTTASRPTSISPSKSTTFRAAGMANDSISASGTATLPQAVVISIWCVAILPANR